MNHRAVNTPTGQCPLCGQPCAVHRLHDRGCPSPAVVAKRLQRALDGQPAGLSPGERVAAALPSKPTSSRHIAALAGVRPWQAAEVLDLYVVQGIAEREGEGDEARYKRRGRRRLAA